MKYILGKPMKRELSGPLYTFIIYMLQLLTTCNKKIPKPHIKYLFIGKCHLVTKNQIVHLLLTCTAYIKYAIFAQYQLLALFK